MAEVSETERAHGQVAGRAAGYRFLGRNHAGDYVLVSYSPHGPMRATCARPCAIIRLGTGETMVFTPDSVIGAAFTDAFNGPMERAPK